MPRYLALLRGVSPTNASMADLRRCLETAGYENVKTILASGNVALDAKTRSEAALAAEIEAAMKKGLGYSFATFVRSQAHIKQLIDADPFARHKLPSNAKRVVTFLRTPPKERIALPIEQDGASILAVDGSEAFSFYVPGPKGPVFMTLIEKTFGKDVTTRTWDTVRKCANA